MEVRFRLYRIHLLVNHITEPTEKRNVEIEVLFEALIEVVFERFQTSLKFLSMHF